MKKLVLLITCLFLFGFDCSAPSTGTTTQVPPHPTPVVVDTDLCDAAQVNLQQLKCELGNPTKKGKTFAQFCRETQSNGIYLNPKCLSTITSCDQAGTVCAVTK